MLQLKSFLIAIAIASGATSLSAQTINTAQIITGSYSQDCLDWRITGLCLWLKCTLFGCYVVSTPRIAHRLPEFTVSAYSQTGQPPWQETKPILEAAASSMNSIISGGHLTGIGTGERHQESFLFNEADVIGNPALSLLKFGKFLCKPQVKPFHPYYLSILDAVAWRSGLPDSLRPESITPGAREIGNWPRSTWGSVYPRSGLLLQSDPAKAAAVISQRAIDIVTRDRSGHVHRSGGDRSVFDVVRGDPKSRNAASCELSGGSWKDETRNEPAKCVTQTWRQWATASNEKTDRWQMLLPRRSKRCESFGAEGDWSNGKIADQGNYMWNYWREYKCCVKAGGSLVKTVEF